MSKWNPLRKKAQKLQLAYPHHDLNLLPVPISVSGRRSLSFPSLGRQASDLFRSVIEKRKDSQVVAEFRNKLRQTEDLISKLAFSLREIQGARRKPKTKPKSNSSLAAIQKIGQSRTGPL
jgi:hypothetical protein